jgi:hypothetical protein
MKAAGLLVGYPDGLFRGGRPASRYELAVAIHATYQHLKNLTDGIGSKIGTLEERIAKLEGGTGGGEVTRAELQALRDALNALKAQVDGMKTWGDDIAALKRMASTFERELASLGVDVESMKKGLTDLANRVAALEKRKLPIDINGNLDLVAMGGFSSSNRFGITKEGRPTGVHKETDNPTGIGHDLNAWHQGTLVLTTTNEEGPKGKAALAIGNTMSEDGNFINGGFSGGSAWHPSSTLTGQPFRDWDEMDIWFQEFNISGSTSAIGTSFEYVAGRFGIETGKYFIRRHDTSLDFKNSYWDDGKYYGDGFKLGFGFGNVDLDVFGMRNSTRFTSDGTDPWFMVAGNYGHPFEPGGASGNNPNRPRGLNSNANGILVDQSLGIVLNVPIMARGHLMAQYVILDSDTNWPLGGSPLVTANRVTLFGGEVKFPIGGALNLVAGYSQTNMSNDDDTVVDEDNAAMYIKAMWNASERWGIHAGWKSIDPQFGAPGAWDRVGIWWNPTDVRGWNVGGWFNISDRTKFGADFQMLTGQDNEMGTSVGLSEDDEVRSFKIHVSHQINPGWAAMLGYERVDWDVADRGLFTGGSPREQWFDIGFKFNFNQNSWWSIMWQTSDYDGDGVGGFNPFSGFGGDRATGGKITTQFSTRFGGG